MKELYSHGITNLGFINKTQLVPLGITDSQLHFAIGLLGIILCFYFLTPLVKLLVVMKWSNLLTYILGSLLFLIILGFYKIIQQVNNLGEVDLSQMANVALGITFFGAALCVFQLTQAIIRYLKQQKSKTL